MKKVLFASLSVAMVGVLAFGLNSTDATASDVNLTLNKAVEMVPVDHMVVAAPSQKNTWEQSEWFDSWWADYNGFVWYTPEAYSYTGGDTVSAVNFTHLEGGTHNFSRIDAFYMCGATNPMGWVLTGGIIDFGSIPENQPNYGWITGVGYTLPNVSGISVDGASRILWNGNVDCGVPLSGRPDCFSIN